jgi:hypothetical protein
MGLRWPFAERRGVQSHMALLRPEDVKDRDPSGHVSTMPNQGSKSY